MKSNALLIAGTVFAGIVVGGAAVVSAASLVSNCKKHKKGHSCGCHESAMSPIFDVSCMAECFRDSVADVVSHECG